MFFDIGPLELVALVVLAVLVFGPDKLPKVIQDAMAFIRKVREFSDSAREDLRRELGPEFKDFEFEDLNPKTFIRKNLMTDDDEYGLSELKALRDSFDLRTEMADITEITETVNGVEPGARPGRTPGAGSRSGTAQGGGPAATTDWLSKRDRLDPGEPPPFDSDAT